VWKRKKKRKSDGIRLVHGVGQRGVGVGSGAMEGAKCQTSDSKEINTKTIGSREN
jgi:hypothetical protein